MHASHPTAESVSPLPVLSRARARALDHAAVEELGIPSIVLMENAAASIEHHARRLLRHADNPALESSHHHAVIFCGPGNNGGDGYALARRLQVQTPDQCAPVMVTVVSMAAPSSTDAATNHRTVLRMGTARIGHDPQRPDAAAEAIEPRIQGATSLLLVDALLGTGLTRPLDDTMRCAVRTINTLRRQHPHARVLAVDIPTGLDCDTGEPTSDTEPRAVVADLTVTLAGLKKGFRNARASVYTGKIEIGSIGLTAAFTARFAEL